MNVGWEKNNKLGLQIKVLAMKSFLHLRRALALTTDGMFHNPKE